MASDDEFNEADLCFISNVETNIFDEMLDSYGQLRSEESNSLVESEAETDLTDLEEGLYPLTKGQSFTDWKDVENKDLYDEMLIELTELVDEQEGRVLQSDDEYNYKTINNLLKPQTKGQKRQKCIAAFNNSARKKVLKKTTNVLQNDDLVKMASSNISNESINIDSTEGTKVDIVNEDMEQSIQ
ncbi:31971_t:CDS:2, partial [Racocetra persica]